ncbi:hypothetical protein EMIT0324P_130051 [Pseudomonas chlororaphis]
MQIALPSEHLPITFPSEGLAQRLLAFARNIQPDRLPKASAARSCPNVSVCPIHLA